jgi:hypothetical protein
VPDFLFWNEVVIPLAGMALSVTLGWPIARAIGRRIERRGAGGDPEATERLRGDVEDIRRRLDALEDLSGRLGEVEERLEFTERLLTRQRESGQLPS